ncbi:hypothetical protein QJS10_CPA10g00074 [Acorus calamus]|uniref:SHSP domain-containing protein n=1 Tax=Acorus calamus TaxID=4465 RepID=A0AAV9E4D2_ACOCL|nr:hypothetical protein QJS10_CPA10g00074 [Acorus calamus]
MQKKRKTKKDSPHGGSKKNRGILDPDDVEVIPLNSRFSPLGSPAQETHFFGASDLSTPAGLALASAPRIEQWNAKSRTYLTGTALSGKSGPPVGSYDIGESDDAYLFRVSLPGVKREADRLLATSGFRSNE